MAQQTMQIPISADTYTSYDNPNTSYGDSLVLKAGGGEITPESLNAKYHVYLKWDKDLFTLPVGKKLVNVYLCLYVLTVTNNDDRIRFFAGEDFTEQDTFNTLNSQSTIYDGKNSVNFVGGQEYWPVGYRKIQYNGYYSQPHMHFSYGSVHIQAFNSVTPTRIIEFASRESENPPYFEVVYDDIIPSVPEPINPIGTYTNNQNVIRFEWRYNNAIGGDQTAFDLQWSQDQTTWNTIHQESTDPFYEMPANTLPSGNIYWRVQIYNEYGNAGGYSQISAFYAIGAPSHPIIISISSDTARPTVVWTATSEQQVYQVQVLQGDTIKFDTGLMPSLTDDRYKIKTFLDDGNYTVRVRIKNKYDLWSEWSELGFTIATNKPDPIALKVFGMYYGARLTFAEISEGHYGLVYRKATNETDYICIAKIIPGQTYLDDYTCASGKTYQYFVRNVSEDNEAFSDSTIVPQAVSIKHTQIAPAHDPSDILVLKYNLNARPGKQENKENQRVLTYFEGRKYPVSEYNGFSRHELGCTFFLNNTDAEKFTSLFDTGTTVLIRDNRGRKIYGSLGDIVINETSKGYVINFTLSRVDYSEGIEV